MSEITEAILKCIKSISQDPYHRFRSWDHCHAAFASSEKDDRLALELAFYLASWGMYRGSSGLLQKDYKIHNGAVDILFENDSLKLKCSSSKEVCRDDVPVILDLKDKLVNYYKTIEFVNGKGETKKISPTHTLISKILLGCLGCTPAYDQYFVSGLSQKFKGDKKRISIFGEDSLKHLFQFIEDNKVEIAAVREYILQELKTHYPVMKIVDMYFWQLGYENELAKSKAALKANQEV